MKRNEIERELSEKLEANYISFLREWTRLEPFQLIEKAEEIAATKLVYEELKGGGYSAEHLNICSLQNPLEVV